MKGHAEWVSPISTYLLIFIGLFCQKINVNTYCCRAALCQQNRELLDASDDSDVWKAYVDYVDEIIVDGFFNTIMCSLKFMIENTDAKTTTEPLYEAVLELRVRFSVHRASLSDAFYTCRQGAPKTTLVVNRQRMKF